MRILVIEDDPNLNTQIKKSLEICNLLLMNYIMFGSVRENKVEHISLEISTTLKVKLIEGAKRSGISIDMYIKKILIKKL